MKYEFSADAIDLGIDDAEEVYTITFTDASTTGGAPDNYLLLQRSVAGIGDPAFVEPYVELNDSSNGRFADSIVSGELLPNYLNMLFKPSSGIFADPSSASDPIDELVVRFDADGPLLRRMKYALDLVISDAFPWQSLA